MKIEFNFLHILTLIFVIARIFNFIQWSWWLVFLPSIISISVGLIILIFIGILAWFE